MKGISKLNKEVERILRDPTNQKDSKFRVWRNRYFSGQLSLEKKIEIAESFGTKKVTIILES